MTIPETAYQAEDVNRASDRNRGEPRLQWRGSKHHRLRRTLAVRMALGRRRGRMGSRATMARPCVHRVASHSGQFRSVCMSVVAKFLRTSLALPVAAALVAASCASSDSSHLESGRKVEPALDQPSALQLIGDLGDHGTFDLELRFDVPTHAEIYHGRYGTLSDGVVFTWFDMDIGLVNREVRRLMAHRDRFEAFDPGWRQVYISKSTKITDELQVGLADVLMFGGFFGSAGFLALEPTLSFAAVGDGDPKRCEAALSSFRDAVRQRLLENSNLLGPDWQPDREQLGGDELTHVYETCSRLDDTAESFDISISDTALQVDSGSNEVLSIRVHPGDGAAPDPEHLSTTSVLDRFSLFFLAIDRCGGLPWLYSDFAATITYTPPTDYNYVGPTPFGEVPVCAAEVPPDARDD